MRVKPDKKKDSGFFGIGKLVIATSKLWKSKLRNFLQLNHRFKFFHEKMFKNLSKRPA